MNSLGKRKRDFQKVPEGAQGKFSCKLQMHAVSPLIPDGEQDKIHKVSIKKCHFLETNCLKLSVIARKLCSFGYSL